MEAAANSHGFTNRFHCGGQHCWGTWKFFEGKAGDFGDHIVNRRFKAGWGDFSYVIVQLIKSVTYGQFCCNFGDWKACCFGCQSRRTRHPWVHLDDNHTAVFRVHSPLYVRSTSLNTDFAQYSDASVTHDLVFFVGQCQSWSHCDTVACVHAHGVNILDGANDDGVVCTVANHFHFEFFPAKKTFINQNLANR